MIIFARANQLFWLIKYLFANYFWSIVFIIAFIVIMKYKKDFTKAGEFIKNKFGMIILDGKFWKWKNRFMVQLQKESIEKWYFVLSNFYSWHTFQRWNSLNDLRNLLYDIWLIWEYQNFTDEDIRIMYLWEWKKSIAKKMRERKKIRKLYKFIPASGFYNKFLITCDEFQNLFFSRGAMSNFSGENEDFLKLLHQVRHYNTLMIFATQEASELDVKFRRLSSYYIRVFDKINELIYWYNVFEFKIDKENNMNLEQAKRFTKVPVWKINGYKLNIFINKIEKIIRKKIKYRFKQLPFQNKFNANPENSIYKPWDMQRKLNEYYKKQNNKFIHTNIV